jgi:cytochrome c oxidase assembly factor CtaG
MKPRPLALFAGVVTILVAITVINDQRLSGHMVQHLLLIDVAPPLLLAGRPMRMILMSLSSRPRRSFGRGLVAGGRRAHPAACLALFAVIVLGFHVPVLFNAAVRHPALHALEHGAFIVAGLIVWWPLLGEPNPRRQLGTVAMLLYLTVAMLPMTVLGAYLDRDTTVFYSVYAGPGAVLDQQQGGAIMWVASTATMGLLGIAAVLAAMLEAERRQRVRELHEVAR